MLLTPVPALANTEVNSSHELRLPLTMFHICSILIVVEDALPMHLLIDLMVDISFGQRLEEIRATHFLEHR